MKNPKTNIQEILYTLIEQGEVSIFDYSYLSGFRTRISDLRLKYGLKLKTVKHQKQNKFGNTYTYCVHKLLDKEQAIKLYKDLTDKN